MTSTYADNYPLESPSITLYRKFIGNVKNRSASLYFREDSKIPEMICPTNIMQECQELVDLNRFYLHMTSDCKSKFSYVPTSVYKILDYEFKAIWLSFKDSISALRHQNHEFNTLYTDQKTHIKLLSKKKVEFYMNLFLVISSTQI